MFEEINDVNDLIMNRFDADYRLHDEKKRVDIGRYLSAVKK